MSDSENPTPEEPEQPEQQSPQKGKKPGDAKRSDRQQSNNLFWYLMVGGVVVAIAVSLMNKQRNGEEVKYSEFKSGLEGVAGEEKFHAENVYELKIGLGELTFQDQPKEDADKAESTKYFHVPTVGISDEELGRLELLLLEKKIIYGGESPPSEWQTLGVFLFLPIMFLLFFIFLFRRVGGAGSAMSFGRSRGRLYAQEEIETTFNDVAGIDEAVEELREVVEFLRTPGKYQALGGRIPRGVLLVGPPGTGKTLLARAVAGEAGVPFYSLSGSDFVEMFVGVGAARVRDMFQQAGQRSPSIIFIDELDALGKTRGSGMPGGHDEREQTLNALLVEMDGFSSDQSVIVMAATNRPETLDPALMRPGRFDRHVLVDRPDMHGREAILKVHSVRIKMDDSVDLSRLSKLTSGFVGADLANLVNEAALLAARNDKKRVTMAEFEEGIERVIAGLAKSTRLVHEDEKQRVAYHECGHALVACSLPNTDPVHKISIIPRGLGALGYTLQRPEDDRNLITQSELESRISVLLGGIAAEEIIYQEISTGAQNDLQRATDIARRMVTQFGMSKKLGRVHYSEAQTSPFMGQPAVATDPVHSEETMREIDLELKRIIDSSSQTAHEILSSRKDVLEHMTRDLIEAEVMDSAHLNRILDEHHTSPQIKPGTFAKATSDDETVSDPSEEESPPLESADGA